ncbi:derlin [Aureococcus anophagefferens]|uniref:Derlin n=1 Tax=Aureococcus anophagefferens TaxID=44056 RepID=A0ABR1G3B4_AURAN
MAAVDPWSWYTEIPVVSRVYLTASFVTTARACALDLVSPFALYYNFSLIFHKGQLWRLATNFFFFGMFSLDFLFHLYFLVRYCRLLEEGEFRWRTLDFVVMLGFARGVMLLFAPLLSVHFLGSSLAFMMVYVWGRRNDAVRMSFLGLFRSRRRTCPGCSWPSPCSWATRRRRTSSASPSATPTTTSSTSTRSSRRSAASGSGASSSCPSPRARALSGQPRPRRPAPFVPPPDLAGADADGAAADDARPEYDGAKAPRTRRPRAPGPRRVLSWGFPAAYES